MRTVKICLLMISLVTGGSAQQTFRRHSFSIGAGAAVPGRDLNPQMSSAFQVRLGYGYRFLRYLQADTGLNIVFQGARVEGRIQSLVGESKVRDFEYLVPFGGRAVLPLSRGRLELFAGGGGAYLRYQEEASVPSGVRCLGQCYYDIQCFTCRSRSGWGKYATAGAAVALDRRSQVWLGLNTQLFLGGTSGDSLGSVPALKSRDKWVVTSVDLIGRF